jgi:aminoglycoside phosphotransferase family enzyme
VDELGRKLAFLSDPASYAGATEKVDAVETHMSWVFLTDREALKLKKPIRLDGVDFTNRTERRRVCGEEVRLNRRLAPQVYLGVLALVTRPDGGFGFGEEEARGAVDYLVRMRRLPADRLLDRAIPLASAKPEDVDKVADLLSDFYLANPAPGVGASALAERLSHLIDQAEAELLRFPGEINSGIAAQMAAALRRALSAHEPSLLLRATADRIVEGHGDLRPEHVFLGPPPCVIDCLEFDRRLRLLDWSEEVSFLELECERLGAPWIGARIIARCCERLADAPPYPLLAFYRSVHAFGRARIAIRHLRDEVVRQPEKWRPLTRRYLELAGRHLARA